MARVQGWILDQWTRGPWAACTLFLLADGCRAGASCRLPRVGGSSLQGPIPLAVHGTAVQVRGAWTAWSTEGPAVGFKFSHVVSLERSLSPSPPLGLWRLIKFTASLGFRVWPVTPVGLGGVTRLLLLQGQ